MKYIDRNRDKKAKRKKKYKIKVFPTVIATGLVVVFTAISIVALGGVFNKEPSAQLPVKPSSPLSKTPPSSEEVKNTAVVDYSSRTESPSLSSTEVSSIKVLSQLQEPVSSKKNKVSSGAVSSEAVSSEAVSSEVVLDGIILNEDNLAETNKAEDENDDTFFKAPEVPLIDPPLGSPDDWNLILLNHEPSNKIDSELSLDKTKFDSQYVDSRAAKAYEEMYAVAKEKGITLFLRSGYRSIKTQNTNYNANIQREIKRGHNKEEAVRLTKLYYTEPGHSEHHTGLAFDIITPQYHKDIYALSEKFAQTDAYKFMSEHCAEFGFVLRYPKEKKEITAINFEPWHYRYVGIEHAKYMQENNLCLEEYIGLLNYLGR